MTTVAIDKNYMVAADMQSSSGTFAGHNNTQKVFRVEDDLVMGCGMLCEVLEFVEWYKGDKTRKVNLDDCGILVLKGKKLYVANQTKGGSIHLHERNVPWACGSGGELAIGAMLAGKNAEEAVKIASIVDRGTGSKVKVYRK